MLQAPPLTVTKRRPSATPRDELSFRGSNLYIYKASSSHLGAAITAHIHWRLCYILDPNKGLHIQISRHDVLDADSPRKRRSFIAELALIKPKDV
jgi:hypothetical protein